MVKIMPDSLENLENLDYETIKELEPIGSLAGAPSFLPFHGIVHSLKNSISGISTAAEYISMIATGMESESSSLKSDIAEIDKFSKGLMRTAEDMSKMVMAVLDKATQDQCHQIRNIDLNSIISNELLFVRVREDFRAGDKFHVDNEFHRGGIRLQEKLHPKKLMINVVPHHVSQVFNNLLFNSLEALATENKGEVEVFTFCDEETVGFEVRDSGPGIPEDILEKIFDPYFSTKEKGGRRKQGVKGGSGIGLYSSLNMVKQYGGEIIVKPNLNPGCSFLVSFPIDILEKSGDVG